MALLKHQIMLHPDTLAMFDLNKPVTPFEYRAGFSWFLCPITVAKTQEWLLINVEFGYCDLIESNHAEDLEQAVLDVIDLHLPDDREEDNVSVSFDPDDVSWHSADKMPEHVAQRYQQALEQTRRCKDSLQAEDEIEHLNHTPLTIGGRTFSPVEGLVGLLLELADCYHHYIETTPWWKVWWHAKVDHQPWLV